MQPFYRAQPARPIRCDTATVSDQRYFLALVVCLGALLAMRLAGLHTSALGLVMDEAPKARAGSISAVRTSSFSQVTAR